MKFHFIYPDVGTYYYPGVHHGLAQLFSLLEGKEHQVSLQHIKKEPLRSEFMEAIEKEKPDFIGFTAMSNQFEYVKQWSKWIKQKYDIPIICGGVHTTLNPEEVLKSYSIDAICVGEGDSTVLDIANNNWTPSLTAGNLWIKCEYGIAMNRSIPLIPDLDELPFPNYDLFDCGKILKATSGNFAVLVSRGCPYDCTYCCNHALREKQKGLGKYFRYHGVDYTLRLLESLVAKYPIRSFSFADDIFGIKKEWVAEFCEKYPRQFNLGFECNLRAEMATKEMLEQLKYAGCTKVEMGIESGNEWMRNKVLNRKMSNKQIIEAFDNARNLGIKTLAYNMIGLPYETPCMIKDTIDLNKEVKPDNVAVFYFYPFKGTKLYDVCKKEGFLSDKKTTSYVSESILNLPTIKPSELKELYDIFYRYMIERELKSYPFIMRYLFKVAELLLRSFAKGNEIKIIMNAYMKLYGVFHYFKRG